MSNTGGTEPHTLAEGLKALRKSAGWIIALPISSMLALLFAQAEHRDSAKSIEFARSILVSIPLSLVFFVPFLFAERLRLGFPALYGSGVALVTVAYFVQRWMTS